MDQNCVQKKVFYAENAEYHFFTLSVPGVCRTDNLELLTPTFKMDKKKISYFADLKVTMHKFEFTIGSTSKYLKCFVSVVIGSETLLLSNTLKNPTSNNLNGSNFINICYFYKLVNLASENESFQKLKQYPNDALKFICKFIYCPNPFTTESLKMFTSTDSFRNLKTLAAALKNSSESEKISLRVGEEIETVSKTVLCATSPVFSKMFENNMKEIQKNEVTITDIKMPVIKALVSFMYTGELSISDPDMEPKCKFDFLCDLYYASDKYDVAELRQLSVDLLIPLISMENLHQIMKLAFSHSDILLKSTTIALIATNIKTWFSTNDWKNLVDDQPKIAAEVLSFFDF